MEILIESTARDALLIENIKQVWPPRKAYKESDYTVGIAVIHWLVHVIFMLKLTLVVKFRVLSHHCSSTRFKLRWQYSFQKGPQWFWLTFHTLVEMLWALKYLFVFLLAIIISLAPSLLQINRLNLARGHHVTCALIGTSCQLPAYIRATYEWG